MRFYNRAGYLDYLLDVTAVILAWQATPDVFGSAEPRHRPSRGRGCSLSAHRGLIRWGPAGLGSLNTCVA